MCNKMAMVFERTDVLDLDSHEGLIMLPIRNKVRRRLR